MQTPSFNQSQADTDQLRSLAVGFKVMGWLHGLGACVALIFLPAWIGVVGLLSSEPKGGRETAIIAGGGIIVVAALVALLPLVYLWTSLRTAKNLEERRGWGFCFGTSILWLFVQPLGLVLGIIAIIVLHRPSIRSSFMS